MNNMHTAVIPSPVPLVQYGQYSSDLPEPKWKVKEATAQQQEAMAHRGRVLYASNIPYPPESRKVYTAYECKDEEELRAYTKFILAEQEQPPNFLEHYSPYPKSHLLANSLSQGLLLKFNSHFEGGNLSRAYALSNSEYDLYMSVDTNTRGHTQWFSFSVENTTSEYKVRFNIVNFTKNACLLKSGLRPYVFSQAESKKTGVKWTRVQPPVSYLRNNYERAGWRRSVPADTEEDDDEVVSKFQKGFTRKHFYYTLSFEHTFVHSRDTVLFAFAMPYPYTRLQRFLARKEKSILEAEPDTSILFRKEELCATVLGISVNLVTITAGKQFGLPMHKRKGIVVTARVHPGETVGSFVMERVIAFLLSNTKEAEALRSLYVFKMVPMLNPDGVVLGNYRSSVSGEDLNRRWDAPVGPEHNPILYAKRMICKFKKERDILMFCDLHGHSKKHNSFIYGCNTAANEGFASWTKVRLFPRVFARRTPFFSYKGCRFRVEADKMGTGRVVLWKELGITNSFTLETSFYGAACGHEIHEFEPPELEELAFQLLQSLLEYTALLRQIEKEMFLNHGWLKPNRLKELTGTPAQEVLEKEMEKQKRETKQHSKDLRKTIAAKKPTPKDTKNDSILSKEWAQILSPVVEKRDWREYFTQEEMQEAFMQLNAGLDAADPDTSGSDSCPSDDNLEPQEADDAQAKEPLTKEEKEGTEPQTDTLKAETSLRGLSKATETAGDAPAPAGHGGKTHARTSSQPVMPPVDQFRPVRRRVNVSVSSKPNIHEFSSTNIASSRLDSEISDLENTGSFSPTKPSFQTYQYDEAYGGAQPDYNRGTRSRVSTGGLNVTGTGQDRAGHSHQESRARGGVHESYSTMESIQRRVSVGGDRGRAKTSQRTECDPHMGNKLVLKAISKHGNGKMYYLRRPANILLPDVRKVFVPSYQSLEIRSAKYELRHSSQGKRSNSPLGKP